MGKKPNLAEIIGWLVIIVVGFGVGSWLIGLFYVDVFPYALPVMLLIVLAIGIQNYRKKQK